MCQRYRFVPSYTSKITLLPTLPSNGIKWLQSYSLKQPMKNTSLDPAIKRGRWHPGARASCVNRRCMGSRTVVLGQWAVSRQGLQSPVGDLDCKRPGRNSWGPVLCCLALERNWSASGFPRRKFPTASREALPIPGLPVPLPAFFFRSLLSLGLIWETGLL